MERGDYIQTQHAHLRTFQRLQLAYKKNDFPKISIGNGWDLILHELEGSNTFQRDNTLPSLKESTFYIQRENARDTARLEGHHTF